MTSRASHGQSGHGDGLIDLHLHTTASDGRCTPRELVDRVSAAGVTTMAVTDHDTTAAADDVREYAAARGIDAIAGIELTAVHDGKDIHVLGYFMAADSAPLQRFLLDQRALRVARAEAIAARLAELGAPIDLQALLDEFGTGGRAIGRPQLARAMVAGGHVADVQEAFDRWLGRGCPAFVPRTGASPEAVIEQVHRAGGLASLAHPGRTRIDGRIESLRDAGLDALEAFHSDHTPALVERYETMAARLGLLCSGGSDYHGDPAKPVSPGSSTVPRLHWERLVAARDRHA